MCFIFTSQNTFVKMFRSTNVNLLLNDALCNNFHGLTTNYDQGFFPFLAFKAQRIFKF